MTKKTPSRRSARAKKSDMVLHTDAAQAWLLVQALTCKLIAKLDAALRECESREDGWERLFGAKDSTVVNVQKLVAVLAEISDRLASVPAADAGAAPSHGNLAAEDMQMLKRWLEAELARVDVG